MAHPTTIVSIDESGISNRATVARFFKELKIGRHELTAKHLNKRSLPQNAYLHGVLVPEFRKALNSVGYNEVKTDAQAKAVMKSMFLTREIESETGEKIHYVQDTSELNKDEMGTLYDDVIQFCAEHMSYNIPYPNEQLMML